ncbi:CehA/McbA family metallohydrolase [Halosolutus gelatinilyticus]|uniref:CehA/McbA family metallohydrolase n=1 Tax=Halosolutus gelatinilyticus TaxID=2931975 RepID=UPI001FF305F8|nr:PHP domain-containing protein [Halosolutus gelatinilyticus]
MTSGRASDRGPSEPVDAASRSVSIDLHVHSEGSYDCRTRIVDVLERAAEIGLDGVCITDHDAIEQSLAAAEIAPEYGLVGIPGAEVSSRDGHVLAIGVDRCPEPGRPFDRTVVEIRNRGGIAVVPHPFQRSRHGVARSVIDDCDGIEVHNAMGLTGIRNRQAFRFAADRGVPTIAGSDAHAPCVLGRAYTNVFLESDEADPVEQDALLAAIAAGRTAPIGSLAPTTRWARKYATNVGFKLRSGLGRLRHFG